MYVSGCEDRAIPREQGRRILGMSLLVAASLLVSVWLRTTGAAPGIDVLILAAAALAGGWMVNGRARVRGLPLVCGGTMALATLAGWGLGLGPVDAPSAGGMFMALLLSATAPTWKVGIGVTLLLAAAGYVALLI